MNPTAPARSVRRWSAFARRLARIFARGQGRATALAVLYALATGCDGAIRSEGRDDAPASAPVIAPASAQSIAPALDHSRAPASDTARRDATSAGFGPSIGFRSRQRLVEHFQKHGHEFDAASATDYLRQAQRLRDAPVGGDVLELRRGDGSISRFDRASGAFLAFDADGTIRTYFRPNDGEAYFRRQGRRRASR